MWKYAATLLSLAGCDAFFHLDEVPLHDASPSAHDTSIDSDVDAPIDMSEIEIDAPDAGPPPDLTQIYAGYQTSCAIHGGQLRCWGWNQFSQLGTNGTDNIGDTETPMSILPIAPSGFVVASVAPGAQHTCMASDAGQVRCWGLGANGRLGYGDLNDQHVPPPANVAIGGVVIQLAAGKSHTCALLDSGNVRCWGSSANGRLGYNAMEDIGDNDTPAIAGNVNVGGAVSQIAVGDAHTCAVLNNNTLKCWGAANDGQLGYGDTTTDVPIPRAMAIDFGGKAITAVAAGAAHTCAMTNQGDVYCWGRNNLGQLGYGNVMNIGDDETPNAAGAVPLGSGVHARAISAGGEHTCVVLDTFEVRCWGDGTGGALGTGSAVNIGDDEPIANAPTVGLTASSMRSTSYLATGSFHSCLVDGQGAIRCWGYAAAGQLGYGNTVNIGDNEAPSSAGTVNVF